MELKSLFVEDSCTLRDALKITSRGLQIAFVVDKNHKLKGVISDGDIRRALIKGAQIDSLIKDYYNKKPVFISYDGKIINSDVDLTRIYVLPVVNKEGKIISYKPIKEIRKVAFITGITGQDGAYLAYFLLKKGYFVVGGYRRTSTDSFERLRRLDIFDNITLVPFDLLDLGSCISILEKYEPSEVYNLAAQSFVETSFKEPVATAQYTGIGVLNLLEAIRLVDPTIKFYQASSSEMFGNATTDFQSELTPFRPASPYASAKVFGHWITVNYRESYNIFACSGILFNHESPLRGIEFVTRKITYTAAKIKLGLENKILLGNIKTKRDWGYAYDYIKAMWLMLQQPQPDDYVISTGKSYSVEEFLEKAFDYINLDYKRYLIVSDRYFRPNDVRYLLGNPRKAVEKLNWEGAKTNIDELIKLMVDADINLLQGKKKLEIKED